MITIIWIIKKRTLLVTVGSCLTTDMRWPKRVLVRTSLRRTLVALVHSCRTDELKKSFADGRLFRSDTTIWNKINCNLMEGYNKVLDVVFHETYWGSHGNVPRQNQIKYFSIK